VLINKKSREKPNNIVEVQMRDEPEFYCASS